MGSSPPAKEVPQESRPDEGSLPNPESDHNPTDQKDPQTLPVEPGPGPDKTEPDVATPAPQFVDGPAAPVSGHDVTVEAAAGEDDVTKKKNKKLKKKQRGENETPEERAARKL